MSYFTCLEIISLGPTFHLAFVGYEQMWEVEYINLHYRIVEMMHSTKLKIGLKLSQNNIRIKSQK